MVFCPECGHEVDEEDAFCKACGSSLIEENNKKIEKENNTTPTYTTENQEDKILILPIILGIIGMAIGIIEGLNCPILFGWDSIIIEMIISIIGGCSGLFLYKYKNEFLLSGMEFIITGIIMVLSIGNMAMIGCTIFIIAGVSTIAIGKDFTIKNKIYSLIPIITVIIPLLLLLLFGGVNSLIEGDLANQVSINNIENSIALSYGYYDGSVDGEISLNRNFDYIELDIEYYDSEGKVINSGLAWNQLNAEAGKTYHFSSTYINEKKPVSAQITLKDSSLDDKGFYRQNITLG